MIEYLQSIVIPFCVGIKFGIHEMIAELFCVFVGIFAGFYVDWKFLLLFLGFLVHFFIYNVLVRIYGAFYHNTRNNKQTMQKIKKEKIPSILLLNFGSNRNQSIKLCLINNILLNSLHQHLNHVTFIIIMSCQNIYLIFTSTSYFNRAY